MGSHSDYYMSRCIQPIEGRKEWLSFRSRFSFTHRHRYEISVGHQPPTNPSARLDTGPAWSLSPGFPSPPPSWNARLLRPPESGSVAARRRRRGSFHSLLECWILPLVRSALEAGSELTWAGETAQTDRKPKSVGARRAGRNPWRGPRGGKLALPRRAHTDQGRPAPPNWASLGWGCARGPAPCFPCRLADCGVPCSWPAT